MEYSSEEAQLQAALRLSRQSAGTVRGGRFSRRMKVFGADAFGGSTFDGNQVRLPATVMSLLFEDNPVGEHIYQIRTMRDHLYFVGVKDYGAPAGDSCVLPRRLMEYLRVADGNQVELTLVNKTNSAPALLRPLPVATQLTLRWSSTEQYDYAWGLADADAISLQRALETTLDVDYPVLALKSTVHYEYNGKGFDMCVSGLRARDSDFVTEDSEEAHMLQAITASLGEGSGMDLDDFELFSEQDVARLRVPPWEAFDRKLVVEPPENWIPPKPFPDAVWDSERCMYYPLGWEWDELQQTYAKPVIIEPALSTEEKSDENQTPSYGIGYTLGSGKDVCEPPRVLTQAELRQKRIEAMGARLVQQVGRNTEAQTVKSDAIVCHT